MFEEEEKRLGEVSGEGECRLTIEFGANGMFGEEEKRLGEGNGNCECGLTISHPSETDCVSVCGSVLTGVDTETTSRSDSGFSGEGDESKSHC